MPKKTAYSRSGAQRNKTKQKSFELVRPVSDENVLETVESSEDREEEDVVEIASSGSEEREEEEEEIEEVKAAPQKAARSNGAKVSIPTAAAIVPSTPEIASNGSPKSAAARMAARRQAAQKSQRSSSNLITVEHYNYVRKDLIFILILAIIMFSTIIVLHFVLGG